MATEAPECQGNRMTDRDKAERDKAGRLAAALRDNLKRRKAQARELGGSEPAKAEALFPSPAEQKKT